jgi:hypothetical protein
MGCGDAESWARLTIATRFHGFVGLPDVGSFLPEINVTATMAG